MSTPSPTFSSTSCTLLRGHCLDVLRTLPDCSVDCCVTSPPYWGLRDYGVEGTTWGGRRDCEHRWTTQKTATTRSTICATCLAWKGSLGLEDTPESYVSHIVEVFREVRRVLKDEGTLWLVLGDCYAGSWGICGVTSGKSTCAAPASIGGPGRGLAASDNSGVARSARVAGYKRKDLIGIPWMVAFALRADGWYLRSNIIWEKPNCMPDPTRDRPTCAHEFVFLLSKAQRYFYDCDAIREPVKSSSIERARGATRTTVYDPGHAAGRRHTFKPEHLFHPSGRNRRSVWTIATSGFRGPHFATFPKELVRPCIRAGAPSGGLVLDPFAGTGTVGIVCKEEGRSFVGIELNSEYLSLARARIAN